MHYQQIHMLSYSTQLEIYSLSLDDVVLTVYLVSMSSWYCENFEIWGVDSTICRTLKFMWCSKQKIQHIAVVCVVHVRNDPSMFLWIHETLCEGMVIL